MADSNDNQSDQGKTKSNPTPFIDASNVADAYDESRKWLRPYFDPIDEFERIARNRPSDKIDPSLPKITDGTMAAIVQEQPKRVIQQIPTGLVTCKDYPEFAMIADIVLRDELIPFYNRMGDMLQKSWNMVGKGLTWGSAASYTFYTSTNGKMHTDFVIPYRKDILSEKGKVFAPDSNISFMRSWYQERDIKAIINREKAFMARDSKYVSDWDLKGLANFLAGGASAKPADQQTPAEKEKGGDSGGFEVIHAFQKGLGAKFYSFAPKFNEGKPLRSKVNGDPRGNMPIDWMYCNIDLSNPVGRGQVELSGGVQNLIDQQMQMFQFLTTFLMGPALQVWGKVNKKTLKFLPNAIWDMGPNPNSSLVKPYEVNNAAISNFPNNYGLLKSQIMNLNSSQDHSISSDAGNPAQSKTQAGVQAAEQRLGVSDNYLRKQYESWFERQSETSINIHFSEMKGKKYITLDNDNLKRLAKTPAMQYYDKKSKKLEIPYKDINDVIFHFKVDASSSEIKESSENVDKLNEVLALATKVPDPTVQQKVPQLFKLIVKEIGAEGTDELFPEDKVDDNGEPMQPQQPQGPDPQQMMQQLVPAIQQMVQQSVQEAMNSQDNQIKQQQNELKSRELDLKEQQFHTDTVLKADKQAHDTQIAVANQAHAAAQPMPMPGQPASQPETPMENTTDMQGADAPLDPDETELAHALFNRGFDENDVEQAITMKRNGASLEEIINVIGGKYAQAQ